MTYLTELLFCLLLLPFCLVDLRVEVHHVVVRLHEVPVLWVRLGGVLDDLGQHDVVLEQTLERQDDVSRQGERAFRFHLTLCQLLLQLGVSLLLCLQYQLCPGEVDTVVLVNFEALAVRHHCPPDAGVLLPEVQQQVGVEPDEAGQLEEHRVHLVRAAALGSLANCKSDKHFHVFCQNSAVVVVRTVSGREANNY